MDKDILIGLIMLTCAVGLLTYMTFWSRRTIERIARSHLHSVREILKQLNGDER